MEGGDNSRGWRGQRVTDLLGLGGGLGGGFDDLQEMWKKCAPTNTHAVSAERGRSGWRELSCPTSSGFVAAIRRLGRGVLGERGEGVRAGMGDGDLAVVITVDDGLLEWEHEQLRAETRVGGVEAEGTWHKKKVEGQWMSRASKRGGEAERAGRHGMEG